MRTGSITCSACALCRTTPEASKPLFLWPSIPPIPRSIISQPPLDLTDIRQIAVSRLLLDNFSHIKAYWQMMTAKIAQISLRFGADDIDGTVVEEKSTTTPEPPRRRGCDALTWCG